MKIVDSTCGIFLISPDNKILACHPTNHKWNVWSIPKGMLDKNETTFEAAKRELWEETGIDLNKIEHSEPIELPHNFYKGDRKKLVSFKVVIKEQIDIKTLRCISMVNNSFPEVDDYEWVDIEKASKILHETQVKNLDLL